MKQKIPMKKTAIFLFALFCVISCSTMNKSTCNPYRNAYMFIAKDLMTKRKHIVVSDSLFDFDRNFAKILLKGSAESSFLELDADKSQTTEILIHRLSKKVSNPEHLLRFSKMENKMIMAEIVDYHYFKHYKTDLFTMVRLYLFIFDDKMRIKNVFSTNMQSE